MRHWNAKLGKNTSVSNNLGPYSIGVSTLNGKGLQEFWNILFWMLQILFPKKGKINDGHGNLLEI